MRTAIMMAASCALVVGCDTGPSEAELEVMRLTDKIEVVEGNISERTLELSDVKSNLSDESGKCTNAESEKAKRIAELKSAITENLQEVGQGQRQGNVAAGSGWTIAVEELSENQWSWLEEEAEVAFDDYSNVAAREDKIKYSVNPARLASKIEVSDYNGYPAVLLKCEGDASCITAKGRRSVGRGNMRAGTRDTSQNDINEQRSRNFWPVQSAGTSGKVAQAASDLLALYRSGAPEACGKIEGLENRQSSLETEIASLENELSELKSDRRRADEKAR